MALSKKHAALAVLLLAAAVGALAGYLRWRHNRIFVRTENAYITGRIYPVAFKVPGKIARLAVEENRYVKAGEVVAELDPQDFDTAVARAAAALAESLAALDTNAAAIAQAQAQVGAASSQLDLAVLEKNRAEALLGRASIPRQKYDQAATAESVARAQLEAARKAVLQAKASRTLLEKKVEEARTALEAARLQRSYCTLTSPAEGYVSKKTAQVGQVVAAGQPLFAVVPLGVQEIWVEANYKETQLGNVRVGQPVKIWADIDKDRTYRGTVEGISAGTGAVFSLLPPENATGNWVKVVQRVPVRVKIDPASDPNHELRLGLSVTCEIDTRKH